ncbi:MAG: GAF domain-containing protein [Elusimicrobia bacterium]|nr:GAF domain-containing protein [Elusimicrobiota bacterium]
MERLLLIAQESANRKGLEESLQFFLRGMRETFPFACAVFMIEEDRFFRARAQCGFPADTISGLQIPIGEGPMGNCFTRGQKIKISAEDFLSKTFPRGNPDFKGWEEIFLAPVVFRNETNAVFLAATPQRTSFSKEEIDALDPYVRVLAMTIGNSLLMEKLEKFNRRLESEVSATTQELTRTNHRLIQRVRSLKALYEISSTAQSIQKQDEFLELVTARVRDLFSVKMVGFFVNVSNEKDFVDMVSQYPSFGLSRDTQHWLHLTTQNYPECGPSMKCVLDAFESGEIKVFKADRPVSLYEELPWKIGSGLPESFRRIIFHSLAAVPLKRYQESLGAMVLIDFFNEEGIPDRDPEGLEDEELQSLSLVASQVANSIESLQQFLEVRNRLTVLSTLQEVSEAFYSTPVFEFVLEKIGQIIVRVLGCDYCAFMVLEPNTGYLVTRCTTEERLTVKSYPAQLSVKDPDAWSSHVFRLGESKTISQIPGPDMNEKSQEIVEGIRSMIFVPMRVGPDTMGVLKAGSKKESYFNSYHLTLSELVAQNTAAIVQITRLYDQLVLANKELDRLNKVRWSFFPSSATS